MVSTRAFSSSCRPLRPRVPTFSARYLGSELDPEEIIQLGLHTHNKASSDWWDTLNVIES